MGKWIVETTHLDNLTSFLNNRDIQPGEWEMLYDPSTNRLMVEVIYWEEEPTLEKS